MEEHQQLEQKPYKLEAIQRMYLIELAPFLMKLINYVKTLPRMVCNGGSFPRSEINCKTIIFNCRRNSIGKSY